MAAAQVCLGDVPRMGIAHRREVITRIFRASGRVDVPKRRPVPAVRSCNFCGCCLEPTAIDAHRNMSKVYDLTVTAAGDGPFTLEEGEKIVATIRAEARAAIALIDTAPTTREGLLALEAHLRDDRYSRARRAIRLPVILDGRLGTTSNDSQEAVDWLIAQRASEMAGGGTAAPPDVDDCLSAIRSSQARERRKIA
jgi:hypothetical protein